MAGEERSARGSGGKARGVSLFRRAFEALEARRAASIARRLRRHIAPGESVIDLGCGSLVVAEAIERGTGARVTGLETLAYRKRRLPMALYSGRRAPFADGCFDAALIAFVLHHCEDGGLAALREARRLARKRVIVLEDAYDTPFQRAAIRLLDRALNGLENPRIRVPLLFRPTGEWIGLFARMGLRAAAFRRIRTTPILRTPQVLFVLERQ